MLALTMDQKYQLKSWFLPNRGRAACLREDELILDRGRARPREDEISKNPLLADIFGPRSTPRHEVDGMCMTHS